MEQANNLLDEFMAERKPTSRYFMPIVILFSIFTAFLILDMFFSFDRLEFNSFEWDWVTITLSAVIPLSGLFLFISKTRIGWCVLLVYVSLIVIALVIGTFRYYVQFGTSLLNPRQIFLMLITISVCILLQTKSIRHTFRISRLVWVSTMAAALLVVVLLVLN